MTYPSDMYKTMNEEEFPDGLMCMDCKCEIFPGQVYLARPEGMMNDMPTEELICVFCATLAPMAEQRSCKAKVIGSNPLGGS